MKNNINLLLLKKIIKIASLSHNHNKCFTALRLIKKETSQQKIPCFIKKNNNSPFLVAGNIKTSRILFLCHIDVVPGQPRQFNLIREGSRLIGRGVLDMKGPLVATLKSFFKLWKLGNRQFLFVITSDEEIGGFNGTDFLTKSLLKNIKSAIVPDSVGNNLVIVQKAPFHIKIKSFGKSVHGSKPWESVNSAENLSKCCTQIIDKLNGNSSDSTTATLTQIHSGNTTNTIPAEAMATIDIRIKKQSEINSLIDKINQITQKRKCTWQKIDEPLFFEASTHDSFIKKWIDIFKKTNQKVPQLVVESGASDARFLWHNLRIPVIVTSAKGGGTHSDQEWVDINSLTQLSELFFKFGLSFCNHQLSEPSPPKALPL